MEHLSICQVITTYGGLLATVVTAVATVMLWWVTKTLAIETKRLVKVSSTAHVVATLEPNKWSMQHADLEVTNTGNATAYDVEIEFEPPLQNGDVRENSPDPFNKVSVLKPGKSVSSYIAEMGPILKTAYKVKVSWKSSSNSETIENNTYTLDMRNFDGITRLGAESPLVQIAEQVKEIREDWKSVASGNKKIKVDSYTLKDRQISKTQYEAFQKDDTDNK